MRVNFLNFKNIKHFVTNKHTKTIVVRMQNSQDVFNKFTPIAYNKCETLAEVQTFMGQNFPNTTLAAKDVKSANTIVSQICRLHNLFKGQIKFPHSIHVYKNSRSKIIGQYADNDMMLNTADNAIQSTFIHELGHYNHEQSCANYLLMGKESELRHDGVHDFSIYNNFNRNKNLKKSIRKYINGYATSSPCEFVASMFEAVVNGKKLPDELWETYNEYGGPKILFMLKK